VRRLVLTTGLAVLLVTSAPAGTMRMVVADLPYARVWDTAVRALADYPIERAADGILATGWRERDPRPDEAGWRRVRARVTLRVEPMGERITRITAEAEVQGRRDGDWLARETETEAVARAVLARVRDLQ
jgi:hypothetical protein